LVAGAKNGANHTTWVIAKKDDEGGHFNGFPTHSILIAVAHAEIGWRPIAPTDGVTGYGCLGGAGLRGLGCQPESGRGDLHGGGTGGPGVVGHGGNGDLEVNADPQFAVGRPTYDPGPGVVGIGGSWTGPRNAPQSNWIGKNRTRRDGRGAAGVVGVAGGDPAATPLPSFDEMAGCGVVGASATGSGVLGVGGPNSAGVSGRGGSIGVQGSSDGGPGGSFWSRGSTAAVRAEGMKGGIDARGVEEPAGIFSIGGKESWTPLAQLRLVPWALYAGPIEPFQPQVYQRGAVTELPRW
jgi:hypothetical protein